MHTTKATGQEIMKNAEVHTIYILPEILKLDVHICIDK